MNDRDAITKSYLRIISESAEEDSLESLKKARPELVDIEAIFLVLAADGLTDKEASLVELLKKGSYDYLDLVDTDMQQFKELIDKMTSMFGSDGWPVEFNDFSTLTEMKILINDNGGIDDGVIRRNQDAIVKLMNTQYVENVNAENIMKFGCIKDAKPEYYKLLVDAIIKASGASYLITNLLYEGLSQRTDCDDTIISILKKFSIAIQRTEIENFINRRKTPLSKKLQKYFKSICGSMIAKKIDYRFNEISQKEFDGLIETKDIFVYITPLSNNITLSEDMRLKMIDILEQQIRIGNSNYALIFYDMGRCAGITEKVAKRLFDKADTVVDINLASNKDVSSELKKHLLERHKHHPNTYKLIKSLI